MYRNIEEHCRNHFCNGKAINITYSECVSIALVIERANLMRRNVWPSVACPATPTFSAVSDKRHDFQENVIDIKSVF
jgi:hypothetical protein